MHKHSTRHLIDLPRLILIGSGIRHEVGGKIEALGIGRRILIVSGSKDKGICEGSFRYII